MAVSPNADGWTPLHSVAASRKPSPELARIFVDKIERKEAHLLNSKSNVGGNTALHTAAANLNATAEFIAEMRSMDPMARNAHLETAFHVAACNPNPDVVLWMLDVFPPVTGGWDLSSVELSGNIGRVDKLLDICAR